MRVVFAAEVLERQEAWRFLTRILHKVDDGWHLWEVDDPDLVETSSWYRNRSGDRLLDELLRESVVRAAWSSTDGLHAQSVRVTDRPSNETWELEPKPAAWALEEPLRVVVEDRESDGLFLDVVVRTLGPEELVELYELQPSPLKVVSPGGRDKIRRHLETDLQEIEKRKYPGRLLVVFDSDAARPGQPSRESQRIAELCKKHGLPHHRLRKREMESYVPQEALEAWAGEPENQDHRRAIDRLRRLSRPQRDHLPKKGFSNGLPNNSGTLYEDVSDEDQDLLRWTSRRVKPFEEALNRHRDAITARNLRERCGPEGSDDRDELDQLLKKLMRLL